MKPESIYIGDIMKIKKAELVRTQGVQCMGLAIGISSFKTEEEKYKENATLIKVGNGGYVDIDSIHSVLDLLEIKMLLCKDGSFRTGGIILVGGQSPFEKLYVDLNTIKPYENIEGRKNISVWQLKKERKNKFK